MHRIPAYVMASALALAAVPAAAQDAVAEFYKGKQVKIVIGNSPGGGFDDHGRLLAQHLGRHIPGHPTIIPQNMPGAATLKAIQYLVTTAPQDGTVIAIFNPNLIVESLTDAAKIGVDFTKMNFLGSAMSDGRVCFTWHATGLRTFEDVLKANEVIMGATTKSSNNYTNSAILRNVFGARIKHVLGYPGSTEQYLAIERGELMGTCGSWNSIPENLRADRKIVAFVRYSEVAIDGMPEIPYIVDKARSTEERQLLNLVLVTADLGRPYVLGPGVPPDRLRILRDAFDKTMKDKDFLTGAAKMGVDVANPASGSKIEAIVKDLYATPANVLAKMASAVE